MGIKLTLLKKLTAVFFPEVQFRGVMMDACVCECVGVLGVLGGGTMDPCLGGGGDDGRLCRWRGGVTMDACVGGDG